MRIVILCVLAGISWSASEFPQEAPSTLEAQKLSERFRKEKLPLWADGDQLTAYFEGDAQSVQIKIGGLQRPLKQVKGSKVWSWTERFVDLDKGVLSYSWDIKSTTDLGKPKSQIWRGANALAPVVHAEPLRGTISKHRIRSEILGTERDITVYLPQQQASPAFVVYAADGEECAYYASVLEPLISSGKLPPTAIVGVHSGGYEGGPLKDLSKYDVSKDLRAIEYLPYIDSARFEKHARFFADEVPRWAETTLGVSSSRERRAIFGVSNGGRFAATIGIDRPDVFGNTIAFSLAVGTPPELEKPSNVTSRFYFCAGTWEEKFLDRTFQFHQSLQKLGIRTEFVKRVSGHDMIMWQEEFAHAISKAFSN